MNDSDNKLKTRRELFRTIGRGAAASALAVAALLARRSLSNADPRCANRDPCGDCAAFSGCKLSRADAARATLKET